MVNKHSVSGNAERVQKAIQELAETVKFGWGKERFAEDALPTIAATALASSALLTFTSTDIFDWALTNDCLPPQKYRKFGNPPLNLFTSRRFFIECLVWLRGQTSIHEHAFSGGFGLLHGRSIHVRYRFKPSRALSDNFILGDASLLGVDLLSKGSTHEIVKGSSLTHALYHLDAPTLTIVVRTERDPNVRQHSMLYPNVLAVAETKEPDSTLVRLMETLADSNPDLFKRHFLTTIQKLEVSSAYNLTLSAIRFPDLVEKAVASSDPETAELLTMLVPIAQDQVRKSNSTWLISDVLRSEDVRLFAALLLNVPSLDHIYEILKTNYPDCDVVEHASELMTALIRTTGEKGSECDLKRLTRDILLARHQAPTLSPDLDVLRTWHEFSTRFYIGPCGDLFHAYKSALVSGSLAEL